MSRPRGTRRQQQSAETRLVILNAARRLFGERGYAATTISAIAIEAGVAIQTIYDSVGSKRAMLLALPDLLDEEVGVAEFVRVLEGNFDPKEQIAAGIKLSRQFPEKYHDLLSALISAAPIEPEAAEALHEGYRRHRAGTSRLVHSLASRQLLRPDVDPNRAGDIFGLLTSVQTFRQLTIEFGWTFDQCEEWMIETVVQLLLPDERQTNDQ